MIAAEVTVSAYGNRPLEELQRLIDLRTKRLGECAKDAAVASMIDAVHSLRGLTVVAKPGKPTKPKIEELSDLRVGRRPNRSPCLKPRGGHGEVNPKCRVKFFTGNRPDRELRVFRVTSEHENVKPYIVATDSAASALRFERSYAKRRIQSRGGLARTALSIAMAKLSTRNENTPTYPFIQMSKIVSVGIEGEGTAAVLNMRDNLGYAALALRGGKSAVNLALAKAANKISGLLIKHLNAHGDMALDLKTPFPEVRKRS